jgi:Glycosyl transferases group 1
MDVTTHSGITKNFQVFNALIASAHHAAHFDVKAQRCAQAALFATQNPCGILYSQALETMLQELAMTIPMIDEQPVIADRFLHVVTRCYLSGGHTRVLERWIAASPANQCHDVVLISQGTRPVPELLIHLVQQKSGEMMRLKNGFALEKAVELRALSDRYQAIILHVHPYDIVPMSAFSHPEFSRPIIFYNHADHLFWLGASLADLVVNFRSTTLDLGRKTRTITSDAVLPLPMMAAPEKQLGGREDAAVMKLSLGFAAESRVMVTIASAYKYKAVAGFDFLATIREILAREPNAVLLVIGPSERDPEWRAAREETGGRVRAIGIVPNTELDRYLAIADVALESFPVNSPTALMEIARYRVPCLTLATPAETVDAFAEAGIVCANRQELVERTLSALRTSQSSERLYSILERDALPEGFSKKLVALYAQFPTRHEHRSAAPDTARQVSLFEYFIAQNTFAQPRNWRFYSTYMVRRVLRFYVRTIYPFGLTRRLYTTLNSYGLL